MKKTLVSILLVLSLLSFSLFSLFSVSGVSAEEIEETEEIKKVETTLTTDELYDKLLGGWLGQMIGVSWAASTEFNYRGVIMPEKDMPVWSPSMINDAFTQDDLYVEIPFIEMLDKHGLDCDVKLIAENFAKSEFPLWHANYQARLNLQNGIPYPDCGSPEYNNHADDIDWQIEADFLGMIYPGLVNEAAERAFEIGHIMNYGDGVYGGVFVSAMHSAAFTASSVREIVDRALATIPDGTLFKEVMTDVINAYDKGEKWEDVWQLLEDKWASSDKCTECAGAINIDAKLNAAYVLIGLLYGEGDMEKTVLISTRCGQDSDCNPSTAASILGNLIGAKAIESKYTSAVNMSTKFQTTDYTLDDVIDMSLKLAKEAVNANGGNFGDDGIKIVSDADIIAVPYEQWEGGIGATLTVNATTGGAVLVKLASAGSEKIKKVTYDMGDGFVTSENICRYGYEKPGEYTVTCKVDGEDGTLVTLKTSVTVDPELAEVVSSPICSITNPSGSGNKDMNVFCDGIIPSTTDSDTWLQYDTYCGGGELDSLWVGLKFDQKITLSKVKFTEGVHFWDGGWFEKTPTVEVLIDGEWVAVGSTVDGGYPEGNDMPSHGSPFETYTFVFDKEVECSGVRFVGKPGGNAHFISVAEITPVIENDKPYSEKLACIICSVSSPTGGGSSDIGVINDKIIPNASSANDKQQYDTYIGETANAFAYVGYLFDGAKVVSALKFSEGNHFGNGGWFKNGDIKVQILTSDGWVDVAADGIDKYPVGDSYNVFAPGYESYTFSLKTPVSCLGVRIAGTAGGSGFISVSELEVTYSEASPDQPSHEHSFSSSWKSDEVGHWKECECGEIGDKSAHSFDDGKVTKEPTTDEEGRLTYTCNECGYEKTDKIEKIDKLPQTPTTGMQIYFACAVVAMVAAAVGGILLLKKRKIASGK